MQRGESLGSVVEYFAFLDGLRSEIARPLARRFAFANSFRAG